MRSALRETTPDSRPVDIATMRDAISRALPESAPSEDVKTLTAQLRGHINLLIPEVEQHALKLPKHYPPRDNALAAVWVARSDLDAAPARKPEAHLRELAYTLKSLCARHEGLLSG